MSEGGTDLATLVERGRVTHEKEHDQERQIARETALRLEREVEQTALRLERIVEETAIRIEGAVATALQAVSETARVHSEAHAREHLSHERIHTVEKEQVDKAETAQRERDAIAAQSLKEYKDANNEWGRTFRQFTSEYATRESMDTKFNAVGEKIDAIAAANSELRETVLTRFSAQGGRTEGVTEQRTETVQNKTTLYALLGLIATVVVVAIAVIGFIATKGSP